MLTLRLPARLRWPRCCSALAAGVAGAGAAGLSLRRSRRAASCTPTVRRRADAKDVQTKRLGANFIETERARRSPRSRPPSAFRSRSTRSSAARSARTPRRCSTGAACRSAMVDVQKDEQGDDPPARRSPARIARRCSRSATRWWSRATTRRAGRPRSTRRAIRRRPPAASGRRPGARRGAAARRRSAPGARPLAPAATRRRLPEVGAERAPSPRPRRTRRALCSASAGLPMMLAAWNVNSLTVRLPRLLPWLEATRPDVVCLQETKLEDAKFPAHELARRRLRRALTRAEDLQRRGPPRARGTSAVDDVRMGIAGLRRRAEARHRRDRRGHARRSACTCPTARRWAPTSTAYKLALVRGARRDAARRSSRAIPRSRCVGDFNVAPEDRDVHDPALWAGQVLCSDAGARRVPRAARRSASRTASACSSSRAKTFSWWDYRMLAFPKNRGLRIDHILLSRAARRALHRRAASTATCARARSRRTTRR